MTFSFADPAKKKRIINTVYFAQQTEKRYSYLSGVLIKGKGVQQTEQNFP